MTISSTGLVSMEFFNRTKTLTIVYECGADYSLAEITQYADDMATSVIIIEGGETKQRLIKDHGSWKRDETSLPWE